jgi:hypothetical protein
MSAAPCCEASANLAKRDVLEVEPFGVEPQRDRQVAQRRQSLDTAAALVQQREEELSLALRPGRDRAPAAPEPASARPVKEPSLYPISDQPGRDRRACRGRIGREIGRRVSLLWVARDVYILH